MINSDEDCRKEVDSFFRQLGELLGKAHVKDDAGIKWDEVTQFARVLVYLAEISERMGWDDTRNWGVEEEIAVLVLIRIPPEPHLHLSLTDDPAFRDATTIEATVDGIDVVAGVGSPRDRSETNVDAIFLGLHNDDHTHKVSLAQFDPRIAVLVTPEVSAVIKPWAHLETVALLHNLAAAAET